MSRYPMAAWKPVPNHSGSMSDHLGLILHVQQGDGGLQGWFSNPNAQASATWWISRTGQVEQYVDADVVAWAQAAGNHTYNSVETEGFDRDPLTDAQVSALAGLYKWGHDTYGWPLTLAEKPGERGFGWHGMGGTAWGGHFGCPGDLRKAQRADVLHLIEGDDMPTTDEVVHALFARMADADAAMRQGKKLTAEQSITVQGADLVAHRVVAIMAAAKAAK